MKSLILVNITIVRLEKEKKNLQRQSVPIGCSYSYKEGFQKKNRKKKNSKKEKEKQ